MNWKRKAMYVVMCSWAERRSKNFCRDLLGKGVLMTSKQEQMINHIFDEVYVPTYWGA
jgi:hypothetical protein